MSNDAVLESITPAIHNQDPSAHAFLFGSRAKGIYKPDSDWDILILIDDQIVNSEIEDKFRDVLYSIELESGQIISTVNRLYYACFYAVIALLLKNDIETQSHNVPHGDQWSNHR